MARSKVLDTPFLGTILSRENWKGFANLNFKKGGEGFLLRDLNLNGKPISDF